jgi:hypothetical protein
VGEKNGNTSIRKGDHGTFCSSIHTTILFKKAETYVVTTSDELQKVLDSQHSGMVFVECVLDKYDAPIDLILVGHAIADTDYGPRGPHSAVNAQIPLPTGVGDRNAHLSADGN